MGAGDEPDHVRAVGPVVAAAHERDDRVLVVHMGRVHLGTGKFHCGGGRRGTHPVIEVLTERVEFAFALPDILRGSAPWEGDLEPLQDADGLWPFLELLEGLVAC